jgi:hypothetical protein
MPHHNKPKHNTKGKATNAQNLFEQMFWFPSHLADTRNERSKSDFLVEKQKQNKQNKERLLHGHLQTAVNSSATFSQSNIPLRL